MIPTPGYDADLRFIGAVRSVIERLETRKLFSWIGATSGSTNDLSHDYNNPFNWTLFIINDDFSSANLTANTTIYLNSDRTTLGSLNLGYSGNFDLTFASNSTTARNLILTGGVTGDFGGSANGRTVTIGSTTNPVNVDMDGGTSAMNVNAGDSLILPNTLSDGTLKKTGAGTLVLGGANSYSGGTVVTAGVLQVVNDSGNTASTTPTVLGSTSSLVSISAGSMVWLDYLLGSTNNYVTYANPFSGAGTLKVTAPSDGSPFQGTAELTGNLSGITGTLDLFPNSGSWGKTCIATPNDGSQPSPSATIIVENGTTLYLPQPLTYQSYILLYGMGNSENYGALRIETATVAGNVTLMSNTSIGSHLAPGTISGTISDGGHGYSLTKLGPQTITLAGLNNYSGGTILSTGQLNINNAAALGTGVFNIAGGTIDNTSGAPLALAANNPEIWSGSFAFGGSNSLNLGGGAVSLQSNIALTTTAGLLSDEGTISGGYSLTKAGAGSLAIAGANSFSGGNTIIAGTEFINNSTGSGSGSGSVTVAAGGMLGGTGSISGTVTVDSGGTLSPGNGGTAIFSTGSLTLESGSNFDAVINGNAAGSSYDQVDVTGSVDLAGAHLNLSGSRTAQGGDAISLIQNDSSDPVVGTFSGLYEGAATAFNSVLYAITYEGDDGNDTVLTDASPVIAMVASANPSSVTGNTTNLSALGASSAGESGLTYTWSAIQSPAGSQTIFSANDTNAAKNATVTFDEAGSYVFQVSIDNGSGTAITSSVNVTVHQTLSSIVVSPANQSLTVNMPQSFTASVLDQFGQTMQTQPVFAWNSTGGSINSSGLFTAPASPQTDSVSASSDGITGSTSVAVVLSGSAAALPGIVTGTTTTLSVLGPSTSGITYTWTILTKPAGAASPMYSQNGSTASQSTTATFFDAGNYTFQVAIDDGSTTTYQTVSVPVEQTLGSLIVSPANITLNENAQSQFSANGFDQFGHAMLSAPTLAWALQSGLGSVEANGLYMSPGSGMAGHNTVTASSGSVRASAAITVTNAAPTVSISAHANPSAVTAVSTDLTVLGTDDGGEANLTYTWTTIGTPPAAVNFSVNGDNAARETTAVFSAVGTYHFAVTVTDALGLTTSSVVSVTVDQTVSSLTVTPTNASIDQGTQQQLSVSAFDQFGNAMLVTPTLNWSVQSGEGSISNSGLYTAGSTAGSAVVAVGDGSVSATANQVIFNLAPTVAVAPSISSDPIDGTFAQLYRVGCRRQSRDESHLSMEHTWRATGPGYVFRQQYKCG